MESLRRAKVGLRHPALASRYLYRKINGTGGNHDGINIFEEDWDNLIILDACRADYFQKIVAPEFEGRYRTVESRGSATVEWVSENFSNKKLDDTVYISANGWLHRIADEIGTTIHDADWLYTEEFRNHMGTVPPKTVTERAIKAVEKYPNKRLIIHYVQPHKPFLGQTAEKYFPHARGINMHEMMRQAEGATDKDLSRAYEETLNIIVPELERLMSRLYGKTVISADHGELLGERYLFLPFKNYGHPVGIYLPELIEIPWFECEWDTRRDHIAEEPIRTNEHNEEEIEEHLRVMGYL